MRPRWPGITPLHHVSLCAAYNGAGVVRILAAARAHLEARMDFPGAMTPLHIAAYFNNPAVCEALLEVRADATARCWTIVGSGTALKLATKWNRRAARAVLADRAAR